MFIQAVSYAGAALVVVIFIAALVRYAPGILRFAMIPVRYFASAEALMGMLIGYLVSIPIVVFSPELRESSGSEPLLIMATFAAIGGVVGHLINEFHDKLWPPAKPK